MLNPLADFGLHGFGARRQQPLAIELIRLAQQRERDGGRGSKRDKAAARRRVGEGEDLVNVLHLEP